jgi:hypothetical protein
MNATEILAYILLGGVLGAVGQSMRVIVGLKKEIDDAKQRTTDKSVKDWFDARELWVSLLLGAIAGIVAAGLAFKPDMTFDKNFLLGVVAAGYAGADFLGGIMSKWQPK